MSMSQYSVESQLNDWSQLTAKMGIATISIGDGSMSGVGSTLILTAGTNGTVVKSIIVKAVKPVLSGIIRLFIGNGNARVIVHEIMVPPTPHFIATPTPTPLLATFVHYFPCDLFLESGNSLYASTQNSEPFNIIAEALDISYPNPIPNTCSNFIEEYPNTGIGTISIANSNLDGSGAISPIFTAAANYNGSIVRTVSISALDSTISGMVRLFISPDGGNTYYLYNEIYIPSTSQSTILPTYCAFFRQYYHLPSDYILGASTENAQSFGISIQGTKWKYAI